MGHAGIPPPGGGEGLSNLKIPSQSPKKMLGHSPRNPYNYMGTF